MTRCMTTLFIIFDGIKDLCLFAFPIYIAWQTGNKSWLWLLLVSALFVVDYGSGDSNDDKKSG